MQEADFLIGINRTIQNTRYIKLVCARYDRDDYDTVDVFDINENQCITITSQVCEEDLLIENDGRSDSSNVSAIHQEMLRIAEEENTEVIFVEAIKYLYEGGAMSKQTFYQSIKKLEQKGKLKRMSGKGKYRVIGAKLT
jgi:hypothetical protein